MRIDGLLGFPRARACGRGQTRGRFDRAALACVMASTLLEQTRAAHEEVERLERFIASDFKTDAITHKERLLQNHRVNRALDEMVSKTKRLRSAYEDADGARAEEMAAMGGAGEEAYGAFYDRLKETREYHRAYPGFHAPTSEDFLAPFKSDRAPEFSGEEHGGRYLDLHAAHHAFQNASFGRKTDYVAYLADVRDFASVPRDKKFGAAYADYLDALADYLRSFHRRVRPLVFLEKITAKAEEEFERRWNEGAVPGWEDKGVRTAGGDGDATRLDLEAFATVDEMTASLSPDDVRAALGAMGLKQGGTEEQRRDRLWSTRGKSLAEMDKKLFAKGAATAGDSESAARLEAKAKAVARREAAAGALLEQLAATLDATKGQVEKKATLSLAELEAEALEDDDFVEEEDEDEEEEVYNPLKLPLGWDGKPIPYWLYKLHGLNLEFTCEICGNYSYWGRRAYERHFKEPRHQLGMRSLKIPNTKAFAEVRRDSSPVPRLGPRFVFWFRSLRRGGYDGHTHWARILRDAQCIGPRKPVT